MLKITIMMMKPNLLLSIRTQPKPYRFLTSSLRSLSTTKQSSSDETKNDDSTINIVGGDVSSRTIILGTGWAGFNLALNLKEERKNDPEIRIVSPSNHFVFTPLLPSTAVGTLEFRCIQVCTFLYSFVVPL